jgi:hypothetical protein
MLYFDIQQHLVPDQIPAECRLRDVIHTFLFEILLPHIVVIPPEFDINISAIDVQFWMSTSPDIS